MTIDLNKRAYACAQRRIEQGKVVLDDRDAWSEHRPTPQPENDFIRAHGFAEYETWFLGVDDEKAEGTKSRYKFPYGDLAQVHRCGVLSAESRAAQHKRLDIEVAAAHLHGMLDQLLRAQEDVP